MRLINILLIASALIFSGCGDDKKDENGEVAAAPNTNCLQNGHCYPTGLPPGAYGYPYQGQYYQGYNSFFSNGFCGCGWGFVVGYDNWNGLTCIPDYYFTGAYLGAYLGWGWNGFSFVAGIGYSSWTYPSSGTCFSGVAETCVRGQICSNGARCAPYGGATLGFCPAAPGRIF